MEQSGKSQCHPAATSRWPAKLCRHRESPSAKRQTRLRSDYPPKATGAASSSEPHRGEAAATNTEGTRTSALTRNRAQAAIHRPRAIAACPDRTAPCIRFTRETHCFRLQTRASYRCRPPPSGPGRQSTSLAPWTANRPDAATAATAATAGYVGQRRAARRETAPHPHAQPRGSLTPWCPWANAA